MKLILLDEYQNVDELDVIDGNIRLKGFISREGARSRVSGCRMS